MLGELSDHLIGSAQLFSQLTLFCVLAMFLPSGESSEDSSEIIIIDFCKCESLTFDEMLQQVVSLYVKMINRLVHSLDSALGRTYKVLISYNLVNKLPLRELVQYLLGVSLLVLPLLEIDGEWVVEAIQNKSCIFFDSLSRFYPCFPLIQSFGDDVEVCVLEE